MKNFLRKILIKMNGGQFCATPYIQMAKKQGIKDIKLPPETTGVFIEGSGGKKMSKENSQKMLEEIRKALKK